VNIQTAISIACDAHGDQLDKAGEAYILHPLRLMLQFDDERLRIIAVLHDVIEDSEITLEDLKSKGFGEEILRALDRLTKKSSESYEQFIGRVSKNDLAKKVKIADLKDNLNIVRLETISHNDIERIKKYHGALQFLSSS